MTADEARGRAELALADTNRALDMPVGRIDVRAVAEQGVHYALLAILEELRVQTEIQAASHGIDAALLTELRRR